MKRRIAMEIKLIKETNKKAMSFLEADMKSFHTKVTKQLTNDDDIARVVNKTKNAAIKSMKSSNDDLVLLYTKNFLQYKKQMVSDDVLRSAYFKAHAGKAGKFDMGLFCIHHINVTMEASKGDVLAMSALEEKMSDYAVEKEMESKMLSFSDVEEDDGVGEDEDESEDEGNLFSSKNRKSF